MTQVPTWILVAIGIALVLVIILETIEYKRYVKSVIIVTNASKAVNALAAGMQVTFEQVTGVVNPLIEAQQVTDHRLQLIDDILGTHTDILNMKMLSELAYSERKDIGRNKDTDGALLGA